MIHVRALFYADWRALVNDTRRVIRSPGRLFIWIVYPLALGFFFVSRTVRGGQLNIARPSDDIARADYFISLLLVALVFTLATGRGALGIFRSRVEARCIIGSPIDARLAIAYLQMRQAFAQACRIMFSLLYFIFFFGPRRIGSLAAGFDLLLVFALLAATVAVTLPRRLVSRPAGIACAALGLPLAVIAVAPALRDAAAAVSQTLPSAVIERVLMVVPAWHPGRVLLEPQPLWLIGALALSAIAVATLASAGRDVYPELYALSVAGIDRIERLRQRRNPVRAIRSPLQPGFARIPAPAGVLVFVWKAMVEFRRQTTLPYIIGGVLLWSCAGFAAAWLLGTQVKTLFTTLADTAIYVMLFVGGTATGTLAAEIRRPLFWLAPALLFERLCALAFARIWRTVVTFEIVAASFALGGGKSQEVLFLAIAMPAVVALLAATNFATYACFPSDADRGPSAMLRMFGSLLLLLPPVIVHFTVMTIWGEPLGALVAATFLALLEAGALIGVAAWRLDGHIDRLTV